MTQGILDALREAHDLYLEALGSEIATLERVAALLGSDLTVELAELRQLRALAELRCRQIQASYEAAA